MFSLKGSGYMKCPNCKKEMKIKRETGFIPDFSGTADYDLYYDYNIYRCPNCKIKYNEDRKMTNGKYLKNCCQLKNRRIRFSLSTTD